ncbi:MAG: protein kinase, partial [Bacteroidetes bacterium]|nr:protein kinase [Bacteroidota bacterium]
MIGRTISQYRITEKLGGGGMGVVYKAHDTKLDRPVALKFLPPHLSKDPEANKRFVREAKAASALDHPNICTIYDIGEDDEGQLFIAMAYYQGQTLKYRLADGLSIDESVEIAIQVAEGLERAHEAGIVHRDIKPANVMVTERGQVKIVDFGLAKVAEQTQLTKTGATLGTVTYMSPEQARGEEVDHRTDLWSLGVVLYEMLTGERPFRGDYEQAVIYSILNEDPAPITTLNPEAPEGLARVVEKLLSKDAAERYQWVEDLLPDLKVFRSAGSQSVSAQAMEAAPVVPSIWRFVTIGIPVILLLLGGLWALSRVGSEPDEPATPVARTAIAVLPFTVRGDEDLAWLREGMVDLLATKLDGAGELRGIDPNALLGYLARNPDLILDPEGGREVAEHFGATRYVLGTVINTGSERQVNARLYDANGSEIMRTQATFVQNEELMQAVDRLASDLLADQLEDPAQQLSSLASGTTASFEALKAYVEGEQALRQARWSDAEAAALNALAIDSTFALAWYLLNRAQGATGRIDESAKALEQAVRYKDSVSDRARLLIEGAVAFDEGRALEAEQIYRGLVTRYPDDIDVTLGTLDHPERHPAGRHVWVADKLPWLHLDEALPAHQAGTPGEALAARYLAARFEELGLVPGGTDGGWFQPFDFRYNPNPHAPAPEGALRTGRNVLGVLDHGAARTVVLGAHYDHLG